MTEHSILTHVFAYGRRLEVSQINKIKISLSKTHHPFGFKPGEFYSHYSQFRHPDSRNLRHTLFNL